VTRRVVHFVDSAEFGGTEQVLLTLLEGLDPGRWRCSVLHHAEPGLERLIARAGRLGVEVQSVPRLSGRRGLAGLPRLVGELRRRCPDVFHAHLNWPLACTYGLMAAALARVPAVVATQQLFVDGQSRWTTLLHKVVSAWVDRYIAVSGAVARGLGDVCIFPGRKIEVIRNAVTLARYDHPSGPPPAAVPLAAGRPVVLSVARLHRQKGLSYLVAAATLVPDAIFLVAGHGTEDGRLRAQARAVGVADRFLFLGHRDDVPELLGACDVFVLPSLYEGLPVAVLEAMAAGKPVVATAIRGTDEAVVDGETGLLVPPGDASALARAVRTLLSDRVYASRLAAAGRRRARERFSAESMVERVSGLYEGVLGLAGATSGGNGHA
jgi:glycosyltransferase involved in cell wall biosynthesis